MTLMNAFGAVVALAVWFSFLWWCWMTLHFFGEARKYWYQKPEEHVYRNLGEAIPFAIMGGLMFLGGWIVCYVTFFARS